MNISMQLAVVTAVCLCACAAVPEARLARKSQRPTRGFKNLEMMTARGFGKRDHAPTRSERDVGPHSTSERANRGTPTFKSPTVGIARDFGKRTPEENEVQDMIQDTRDLYSTKKITFAPTRVPVMYARGFGKRFDDNTGEEQEFYSYSAPKRRTFKPKTSLMVGLDYGKRSDDNLEEDEEIRVTRMAFKPNAHKVLIARGYGKRNYNEEVYGLDNFWEMLESGAQKEGQGGEEKLESIPTDWFVNEMLNNPDFARSVVRKFIDLNQDGMLSPDELLRNVV